MSKIKLLTLFLLLLAIAGLWARNYAWLAPAPAKHSSMTQATVTTQHTQQKPQLPKLASNTTEQATPPASLDEKKLQIALEQMERYRIWREDRGYIHELESQQLLEILQGTTGNARPRQGSKKFSDYDAMANGALQKLADQGDRRAMTLLAERLTSGKSLRYLTMTDITEAEEYLLRASTLGYTSTFGSLGSLAQIKFQKGGEKDRGYLVDAYAYVLLAEKRGDTSISAYKNALSSGFNVSQDEQKEAIRVAGIWYSKMESQRIDSGLPPFDNKIPADILNTQEKIAEYSKKMMEDFRSRASAPATAKK